MKAATARPFFRLHFLSISADRPISSNTLQAALATLGFKSDVQTVHGFRTVASTMLNEAGFNSDWIEAQLAHVKTNGVRAAYNRAKYLPERRQMMQRWSDMLDDMRRDASQAAH